ncbi:hypothetical protein J7L65_05670 [Candidatus Bathyarchaeota archaeon]|nr:hypothetical protein [Candidatus Bathyarchaeota archaeon]
MAEVLRREVVYLITAIVTVIMFIEFFFVGTWNVAEELRTWATIIANISLGLGAVRLLSEHAKNIQKRRAGVWPFSIWLWIIFLITILSGLAGYVTTHDAMKNPLYNWLFRWPYTSLGQTLYAITGFYIFSAAYRAFRARNIDAALLLIAGCFVILTNAPIGGVIWGGIPVIGRWFLDYGQAPAMRCFLIVAAFGMLAYGFRALLGRERGFYGEVAGE